MTRKETLAEEVEVALGITTSGDPLGITWMDGFGPMESVGPCDHMCRHAELFGLATGPSQKLDSYVQCTNCGCRGWARKGDMPRRWHKVGVLTQQAS